MSKTRNRQRIPGQFAWRLIDMLASPAYRVLSQSAHRVLARLELELADHGGRDNGKLPVTFDDFVIYGIDRHSVAPAIREVVALGFVEITERGRAGNAEWRKPNKFRLTYRFIKGDDQTDEWRRLTSVEEARAVAQAARQERQRPVRKIPPASGETPHRKAHKPGGQNPHHSAGALSPTTLDVSGGASASRTRAPQKLTEPATATVADDEVVLDVRHLFPGLDGRTEPRRRLVRCSLNRIP